MISVLITHAERLITRMFVQLHSLRVSPILRSKITGAPTFNFNSLLGIPENFIDFETSGEYNALVTKVY